MNVNDEVIYRHELVCMMCGRPLGTIDSASEYPPRLLVVRRMRCDVCGGAPIYSGDKTTRLRDPIVPFTPDEKPKTGRPRKPQPLADSTKVCVRCNLELPITFFEYRWGSGSGRRGYCRMCRTAADRRRAALRKAMTSA